MLRSVIGVPQTTMDKLNLHTKLSPYDMNLIKEVCEILLPSEEATDKVQGNNIVTASMVLICVRGLRQEFSTLCETYNCRLITAL